MKQIIKLTTLCWLSWMMSCSDPEVKVPTVFTNREATLTVIACSRGCEQYVLVTDAPELASLYVVNMPDSLKIRAVQTAYVNDQLPVIFSGVRSGDRQQVSVAAPNDGSKPAFQAYAITLTALRRR
jgi:hypothetical protein